MLLMVLTIINVRGTVTIQLMIDSHWVSQSHPSREQHNVSRLAKLEMVMDKSDSDHKLKPCIVLLWSMA